ncbi:dTDP-4-dehydrorhamnose 3,5-epimerase [Allopusillimonas soli]|uniref:dTDP-4-dehydrorhamnose 3,5-epimerase n=1 Tax=Allopusillimonas soli TaxID=659016 RepID=UPI001C551193|nr:dTDP-4-dehydrorhamnose 3,5-epimerase [Allopusillimonas soli]
MKITNTIIGDVKVVEPKVFTDDRGFFFESFNEALFEKLVGQRIRFVQDNHSRSYRNVLRGLHYQLPPHSQGKLVRVVAGAVYDVAVDIRRSSKTFGQWVGVILSADNKRQLWIPEGFAHAFLVLSDTAEFLYKTTDYWYKDLERTIHWNDSELSIQWPLQEAPILSPKDLAGSSLSMADLFA